MLSSDKPVTEQAQLKFFSKHMYAILIPSPGGKKSSNFDGPNPRKSMEIDEIATMLENSICRQCLSPINFIMGHLIDGIVTVNIYQHLTCFICSISLETDQHFCF